MHVFVYEYTCAAVGPGLLADSLAAEGRAMWQALVDDFAALPGVQVSTLIHPEFGPGVERGNVRYHRGSREEEDFRALAKQADACLVIAPEFNGLLAHRCRWVLESGGRLLGPSPEGVTLAADKLALSHVLREQGIPTPPTFLVRERDIPFPAVWKPRHGAGSQATMLVTCPAQLASCAAILEAELPGDEAIVQPFVPGTPASVALLIGPHQTLALPPAAQHLSDDGRFRYRGGSLPLEPELSSRAVALARRAAAAVPVLQGYIGIDMILGSAANGSGDSVIEINPRLTTSYLGLRALARTNLALAMLQILEGREVRLAWRAGSVEFTADGTTARRPVP